MLEVIINDNNTAEDLGAILESVQNPVATLKQVGRRGANELKTHFRARNQTPNKLGGRRTNFWRQVADSVQNPQLEGTDRIRISITHPAFAQKVYGGPITPKNAGALTIPVDPAAYGRTVSVFQQETGIQLFRLKKKGGGFSNLLAGIVDEKKVTVFYILVARVDQAPDPDALPPREEFQNAILDEALTSLSRQIIHPGSNT